MSGGITIQTAERTEKRKFNTVFNNDIRKYIAEIVTNSDDSYRRQLKSGVIEEGTVCPIYITVDVSRREVLIIDNAEGMNLTDLTNNFSQYGADTSGGEKGHRVRGLFGQGATDVLLNASLHDKIAEIDSIKDDHFYVCKFRWDGGLKKIQPQQSKRSNSEIRKLRESHNIPENGTIVRFGLPEGVKIQQKLAEKIQNFYMLRFILADEKRNVVLTIKTKSKSEQHVLRYAFPPQNADNVISNNKISYQFEGQPIVGNLILEKHGIKNEDEYGELKVLCYDDERNVYDNTLFDYTKNPGADSLHGYLELEGTSKIIRAKLNQKNPEMILTDTRDGFNKHHDFYKSLAKAVEPQVASALDKITSEKGHKQISLTNKEWNEAFREINKYFKDELDEEIGGITHGTDAPNEGIRFIFPSIKITQGKRYTIKLLVNTNLIPVGSKISLSQQGDEIEVNESELVIRSDDVVRDNLATKSVSVLGVISTDEQCLITARALDKYSAKLFVTVIDTEVHYPKYGLEFWPNPIIVKPNNASKAHLYFDTSKHPVGSTVRISADNENVQLTDTLVTITEQHLITESIGVVECRFSGVRVDTISTIKAQVDSGSAELEVSIKSSDQPPAGSSGFLSGISFLESNQFWQTFYNRKDGKININTGNKVNKLQLGSFTAEKPTKDQNKYIAELCATEAARLLVTRKIAMGKIPDTDYEAVLDTIQKEKNKLLEIFVKSIEKLIQ